MISAFILLAFVSGDPMDTMKLSSDPMATMKLSSSQLVTPEEEVLLFPNSPAKFHDGLQLAHLGDWLTPNQLP